VADDQQFPWREPDPTLESWKGDITTSQEFFTFPIGIFRVNDDGSLATDRQLGTCFFISGTVFLTAWHVVADAVMNQEPIRVLLPFEVGDTRTMFTRRMVHVDRVVGKDGRPADIAIGFIEDFPPGLVAPRLPLSARFASPGTAVAAHGYARNQWHDYESEGAPALTVNLVPRFHRGHITEHLPNGRGMSPWPHYVHDAETGGGISGGPLYDMQSKAVCGVNSTGLDNVEFSTAVDIRVALDWPCPFADNRTLRALGANGTIDLRP
jgi:hypothetical protein